MVVREIFDRKLIANRDDINWPPCSPDLFPMDFVFGDTFKAKFTSTTQGLLKKYKKTHTMKCRPFHQIVVARSWEICGRDIGL